MIRGTKMVIVELADAVKKAIADKTGHNIDDVIVETEAPRSTGIFHLKLRHLDDFLDYFAIKNGIAGDLLNGYADFKKLRPKQRKVLKGYYQLFLGLRERYTHMADAYRGCIGKMRVFLGAHKKRKEAFKKFQEFNKDEEYKKDCDILNEIADRFIDMEEDYPWVIKRLNADILACIKLIIKGPRVIYHNLDEEDAFNFCSKEAGGTYVMSLRIRDEERGVASLRTGFQTKKKDLDDDAKWDPIYEEQ